MHNPGLSKFFLIKEQDMDPRLRKDEAEAGSVVCGETKWNQVFFSSFLRRRESMSSFLCLILCLSFAQSLQVFPPLVFLEGNIGAGKSTLVKILRKYLPEVVLTTEPCNEWQNAGGFNLLQAFYENPSSWACLFQIYASMTRIRKQQKEANGAWDLQIMERSWFSDRYCFARMLHKSGFISDEQWAVYTQMWDWYMRTSDMPVAFIYLKVDPQTCLQRLQARSRSEEVGVSLDYLTCLHECHEQLLVEKMLDGKKMNFAVLTLDGSLNFKNDEAVQRDFVLQILDFLKIHGNIDLYGSVI
jgi:deoxyadenosine/deoxycytidine kinase